MTEKSQFKTLVNQWLKEKSPMITPSTHANFTLIVENHLIPHFGKMQIGKIDEAEIQRYVLYLHASGRLDQKGGLNVKTVRDIILVLRLAMEYAYKQKIIPLLNWELIEYPKDNSSHRVISLNKDDEQKLIQCIYMHMNRKSTGILIALFINLVFKLTF